MSEDSTPLLSSTQKRIVGGALTFFATLLFLGCCVGVFYLLREAVSIFNSVLWPLAVAGIFAMLLRPVVDGIQKRFTKNRTRAILWVYIIGLAVMVAFAGIAVPVLISQIMLLLRELPTLSENLVAYVSTELPQLVELINEHFTQEEIRSFADSTLSTLRESAGSSLKVLSAAQNKVTEFLGLVTAAAIVPVYIFYLLDSQRDFRKDVKEQLSFISEDLRNDILFLVEEFVGILVSFFRGQIVIGLIMGVVMSIGFSLIGLKFGIVLGLTIGLLNIVPYLGTIIGLGVVIPLAYFAPDGGPTLVGLALGVFALTQVLEGYVLTPKIMGSQTGLHPMAIIVSIFFWGVALNGILGMILAIPLTAFFVVAWRLLKVKYLPRLSGNPQ